MRLCIKRAYSSFSGQTLALLFLMVYPSLYDYIVNSIIYGVNSDEKIKTLELMDKRPYEYNSGLNRVF